MITNPNDSALTKREEFAKAAMEGMCAQVPKDQHDNEEIALFAVNTADALIRALNAEIPEAAPKPNLVKEVRTHELLARMLEADQVLYEKILDSNFAYEFNELAKLAMK